MQIVEIKKILKERKITYKELSEKSGISLQTLEAIFAGYVKHPRIDTMEAIESALGLNETAEVVPAETRPALQKVIDQCSNLNDLGLAVVFGMVIALMRDHPEYRLA